MDPAQENRDERPSLVAEAWRTLATTHVVDVGGDTADAAFAEMDLRMLVLIGGRERTFGEYQDLAGTAGLRVVAVHQTAGGPAVIECRAS